MRPPRFASSVGVFSIRAFELQISQEIEVSDVNGRGTMLVAPGNAWMLQCDVLSPCEGERLYQAATRGPIRLVVGDIAEVRACPDAPAYANAACVDLDIQAGSARIASSVVGLPPVFVRRGGVVASVASLSSPFLPSSAGMPRRIDLDGVADLLRWGHPIDGRTLFAGVNALPSSSTLAINRAREVHIQTSLPLAEVAERHDSIEDLIEGQCFVFRETTQRLPTERAFVSLSGGLDSRAALVGLIASGRNVRCVSFAGSRSSLDARLAAAFCNANGVDHQVVMLGDRFRKSVPDLIMRTAALTGGVSSLSQAVDMYLYDCLPSSLTVRVSGNLGNQVGRGAVESLSAHQPFAEAFSPDVLSRLAVRPNTPWFIERMRRDDFSRVLFGQEIQFWFIPNYIVGCSRALQVTPYADPRLLELAGRLFARDRELARPTWKTLRKRDVCHRLTGSPLSRSFQRRILAHHEKKRLPGIPLNWGWYASGGWSTRWALRGMLSAADAAIIKAAEASVVARALDRSPFPLGHPSALADWPAIVKSELRELIHDTLASSTVLTSGVFSPAGVRKMLDQHFNGVANHHYTVSRALEIGLGIVTRQAA